MSLTPEEDRLHAEGFAAIREGLAAGLDFDAACARIAIDEVGLRRIVVDDYLKVAVAERHFQAGLSLEELAAELRVPAGRLAAAREEMIGEVARASVEHFRRQSGGSSPGAS